MAVAMNDVFAGAIKACALGLALGGPCGCAQNQTVETSPAQVSPQPMPLTAQAFDDVVRDRNLSGAYLVIRQGDRTLFERSAGDVAADTVMPIASASKWIGGTIVMSAVEHGDVSLESTAGEYFDGLEADKASMTLAQMFSHTAGMIAIDDPVDLLVDPYTELQDAAQSVLEDHELVRAPGTAFGYGGSSMMVAGAMLEKAVGKRWVELSDAVVTGPLGMDDTFWFSPMPQRVVQPGKTVTAPNIQAGVHTSAEDYLKFLTMIAYKGQAPGGPRILSESSISEMERARTIGADVFLLPPGAREGWNYAIGFWCEQVTEEGTCTVLSSPGAFGFYPWINRENGTYGIFAVKDRLPNVVEGVWKIRQTAESELGVTPPSGP